MDSRGDVDGELWGQRWDCLWYWRDGRWFPCIHLSIQVYRWAGGSLWSPSTPELPLGFHFGSGLQSITITTVDNEAGFFFFFPFKCRRKTNFQLEPTFQNPVNFCRFHGDRKAVVPEQTVLSKAWAAANKTRENDARCCEAARHWGKCVLKTPLLWENEHLLIYRFPG